MKRKNTGLIVSISIVVVLVLGIFLILYLYSDRYNWKKEFDPNKSEPFDLGVFYKILKERYNNKYQSIEFEEEILDYSKSLLQSARKTMIVYAGDMSYTTAEESKFFKEYVSAGGLVFINTNDGAYFAHRNQMTVRTFTEEKVKLEFTNKFLPVREIEYAGIYRDKPHESEFNYFLPALPKHKLDSFQYESVFPAAIISRINKLGVDLCRLQYGRSSGYFYLGCNPLFLTNYYLSKDNGKAYLANYLVHLPKRKLIIDYALGRPKNTLDADQKRDNWMVFFRKNPPLLVAFYILLAGIFIFLFFFGIRKQRPIPVIAQPENNSVYFATLMGKYHYKNLSHHFMAKRIWSQFVFYSKSKLGIKIVSPALLPVVEISKKSGADESLLKAIRNMAMNLENPHYLFDANELFKLNTLIQEFYQIHSHKKK